MERAMSYTKPPKTERLPTPSIGLVVVMVVVLFAAMFVAGLALNSQINVLETQASNQPWTESFIQTNRILVMVLGIASLALVGLLTFMMFNLRKATAAPIVKKDDHTADEVQEMQGQLNTVLTNMHEGVIISQDTNVLYSNRALARLTGYSTEEIQSNPLSMNKPQGTLLNELARLHQTVAAAIDQGGVWQGPYKIHAKEGHELDVIVTGTPLPSHNGDAPRIMTFIRGSSQERKLQDQKLDFVRNVSHELRTPLANIKTRIYLLRKQPEKMEEHLQVLENVTNYMQTLNEEMLDIDRFERGVALLQRENVILQDLVTEAVKSYEPKASRRGMTLSCELPEMPIKLLVDPKRILQVVSNLVSNAMNHTPQDGQIRVRATVETGGRFACIQVQDNGVGISSDMLAKVFQPFSIASQGLVSGTVLGLSLAKEIIELHGGEIRVESEVGKGTLYSIRLPIVDEIKA